jgi:hypothetical protein
MIRIREIADPELRRRVVEALAAWRGMSPAAVPEWFELDYVDLLNDLRDAKEGNHVGCYAARAVTSKCGLCSTGQRRFLRSRNGRS